MHELRIWGSTISKENLSPTDWIYLSKVPQELPSLKWVWNEIDRVWQQMELDNKRPLQGQAIDEFYGHPVWIMNGLFTEVDPVSKGHRQAIAEFLATFLPARIADYGGGWGSLAKIVAKKIPHAMVDIIEPYPVRSLLESIRNESRIHLVRKLSAKYDAIIAQDVLEHIEDPVFKAFSLSDKVERNGVVIFANCFYPYVQCHLPKNFHLRHTFVFVMKAMGLRYLGPVQGATHALVFKRMGSLNLAQARRMEAISRCFGAVLNLIVQTLSIAKGGIPHEDCPH